ncbi:hypothetical protein Q1695_013537 [Nippostrongylus brasiliensis]|nr:hypothetical protein Q1695_013537 [Nippostrongylus brasiliensis]
MQPVISDSRSKLENMCKPKKQSQSSPNKKASQRKGAAGKGAEGAPEKGGGPPDPAKDEKGAGDQKGGKEENPDNLLAKPVKSVSFH